MDHFPFRSGDFTSLVRSPPAIAQAHKASRPGSNACRVFESCRSAGVDNRSSLGHPSDCGSSTRQHLQPAWTNSRPGQIARVELLLRWLRRARPRDKGRHGSISANPPQERSASSNNDIRAPVPAEIPGPVSTILLYGPMKKGRTPCGNCRSMIDWTPLHRATNRPDVVDSQHNERHAQQWNKSPFLLLMNQPLPKLQLPTSWH